MPFSRRLVLVGTDHRFSQAIQTHLHKTFLLTAPVVRAEDVPALVTRDTDGAVVFLVADAADVDRAEAVVRELRLMQLPPRLAVLEAEGFALPRRLDPVTAHLDGRFAWPDQGRELNAWVRKAVTPGAGFVDPAAESAGEAVRRRLLALTPSLAPLVPQAEIAAAHDVPVLVLGEPGTGKSHLARLIHDCSARAGGRFVAVPCGAVPGPHQAAELFGHAAGAFVGADAAKPGKLAAAGTGTLLLDEVDALALDVQAALLRVIETGEYEPVGLDATQHSPARVMAAAADLADAADRGAFRRDLFYRLHVVTLHLPPLRARPQDIGPLVRGLAARYAGRFGKRLSAVAPEAVAALEQCPWPGNIRQLENVVQQGVLTCTGETLTLAHLPAAALARADGGRAVAAGGPPSSLAHTRETTERAVILRCLEKADGSRTRAAQALGVSRVTLYKKMVKYGLIPDPKRKAAGPAATTPDPEPAAGRLAHP